MGGLSLVLALVCGWALERAQMIISAPNYGAPHNGFGAIDLTTRKEAKAPMAYRVLVPWLVTWMEDKLPTTRIGIYQGLKVLLNALALWSVGQGFGGGAALLTGLLLLLTIKYDYWSWAPEMAGLAFGMSGSLPLALAGGVLAGLSKETALLVPAVYWLRTGDAPGAAVVLLGTAGALIGVRLTIGARPLYCERWQWRYNLGLFKHFRQREFWRQGQWYHQDIFIACAITGLVVAGALARPEPHQLAPLAILAAGWVLAKADETRVFAAAMPWAAAFLLGG
jgi:hypothetical protein